MPKYHYATICASVATNPVTITIPDNGKFFSDIGSKKRTLEIDSLSYEGTFIDAKDFSTQGISYVHYPPSMIGVQIDGLVAPNNFDQSGVASPVVDYAYPDRISNNFSVKVPEIGEVADFYNVLYHISSGSEEIELPTNQTNTLTIRFKAYGKERIMSNNNTVGLFTQYSEDLPLTRTLKFSSSVSYNWVEKVFIRIKLYIEESEVNKKIF